jgi:hypothetical protein
MFRGRVVYYFDDYGVVGPSESFSSVLFLIGMKKEKQCLHI